MGGRLLLVMLLGVAHLAGQAVGDDGTDPPTLEDLLNRIQSLEDDKSRMQEEIAELRVQVGDDWLTGQRAEEIKNLVADVLADADARAGNLQGGGVTAGWNEHFFLSSADGRFLLQLGGLMQIRWAWNYHDQADRYRYGFENPRTQLRFFGHVFNPDLTYRIKGQLFFNSGFFNLDDAWVNWQLDDDWSVKFGQFKLPFNYEELVEPEYQQVVERSLVNESLNIGYSQGIQLQWQSPAHRVQFAISDGGTDNIGGGGFIGLSGQNSPALGEDVEFSFTGRYEHLVAGSWKQFEQFTSPPGEPFGVLFGIAGHWQRGEFGNPILPIRDEDVWAAGTVDISAQLGGANLYGAVTYHYVDDTFTGQNNILGAVIQGGMYFSPKFEAYARFEYGFFDSPSPLINAPDLYLLTLGGNYYFEGQDVKLSADIGFGISEVAGVWANELADYRSDGDGAAPQVVIRVQLQLLF